MHSLSESRRVLRQLESRTTDQLIGLRDKCLKDGNKDDIVALIELILERRNK